MHGRTKFKGRNCRVETSCTVWAWLDVAEGRFPIVARCGDSPRLTRVAVGLSIDHARREKARLDSHGLYGPTAVLGIPVQGA